MQITRRQFLYAGALALAAAGAEACVEPHRVTVTLHRLGGGGNPNLRLVQLTDLHLQEIGAHEAHVAAAVHELAPDVVVLTGDVFDRGDALPLVDAFLARLPQRAMMFATLGNWEHRTGLTLAAVRETYARRGVQLLVNETIRLSHHGRPVLITGLDDATAGAPSLQHALAKVTPAPNHLLLAHSPMYRAYLLDAARVGSGGIDRLLAAYAPEYMLSGHTHGGQLQILGWAPLLPYGSGPYVSGWYRDGQPFLYVSRGIATSALPFRFGAPPEVACFDWHLRAA